jgi:hypothetical protein
MEPGRDASAEARSARGHDGDSAREGHQISFPASP